MRVEPFYTYTKNKYNKEFNIKSSLPNNNRTQYNELSSYCYKPFFTSADIILIKDDELRKLILPENDDYTAIKWNKDYIPHLDKQFLEYEDDGTIVDLIKAANNGDFRKFLHGDNLYAISNDLNEKLFRGYGFDYDKWLNPPKSCEIQFVSEDNNKKQLKQCSERITYEVNERLLKSPARKHIISRLNLDLREGKLDIPKTIYQSKKKLLMFNDEILKNLDKVWTRAEQNKNSSSEKLRFWANEILTSHDDLLQIKDEIKNINTNNGKNEYNLTIKMWDRDPFKDIFQGNYSTCCIGMGRRNGDMMPVYLLNTSFNMIELVDNNTGNTIGNALCYFAETDNEPVFIIDNVEMNNNFKPSDEVGDKIRDAITEYSKNLLREVCPNRNIKIYMGNNRNDIPTPKEPPEKRVIKFIGDIMSDVYLDVYGGHIFNTDELTQSVTLCRLY